MKKIILPILCLSSIGTYAKPPETIELESKNLSEVFVKNTSGEVSISSCDGEKAIVLIKKNKYSDSCKMSVTRSGDKLLVSQEKGKSVLGKPIGDCDVDFELKVPRNVDLNLVSNSGQLSVAGITGALSYKIGSGNITADGFFKNIIGKSGSGKVDIKGLTGGAEIEIGSGEIALNVQNTMTEEKLNIKAGSGNINLFFQKSAKIKTSFKAGSGEISNEIGNSEDALYQVSVSTGSGDLNILAN